MLPAIGFDKILQPHLLTGGVPRYLLDQAYFYKIIEARDFLNDLP